jgi:microcystin-dependent protein
MDGFLGEIRLFTTSWVPKYWLACNGQTLPIAQNQALYSLIGTTYGGDGKTTFNLPDLRGRVAIGRNLAATAETAVHPIAEKAGSETAAIPAAILPAHNHLVRVSEATTGNTGPAGNYPGASLLANGNAAGNAYVNADVTGRTAINSNTVSTIGGAPATNLQPSFVLNYCICSSGVYPPRS